jgi:carbonic anhydrase/acetyltransferase-like protein (isoleucine patch superfamily)
MVHRIRNDIPQLAEGAFVAHSAEVAGRVNLGKGSSVWFSAVVRGDIASISVGENSNVQDCAVIHCDTGVPCEIGNGVTIGHGAIIHSATIGNNSLIGMGAIVLDGATIGENSIVGAGALVTGGKSFPPGSMILGSPAKVVRELTADEIAGIAKNALHYAQLASTADSDYQDAQTL